MKSRTCTRLLDEKWALMDREISERISRERNEFETKLQAERTLWSERLANERRAFELKIAQLQTKQGFWTRLMKILTWS